MNVYWIKFEDGTTGYCEGESAGDAVRIAEHITGKVVDLGEWKWQPEKSENIRSNPYPAPGMIWRFDHPVYGKTPEFCYGGRMCLGRGSCPKRPSCTE